VGVSIRHFLHRTGSLSHPKVSRTLHSSLSDSKCLRADRVLREYVGLEWDAQGQWKEPFFFVHLTDPQLGLAVHGVSGDRGEGSGEYEAEAERLRKCVTAINKMRPKFVIVTGDLTQSRPFSPAYGPQVAEMRKIMSRVSETIPVLYAAGNHDVGEPFTPDTYDSYEKYFGADYYGFWWGGVRGIVLNSSLLIDPSTDRARYDAQEKWADTELEIAQLNAHHVLVFMHHPLYEHHPQEEPEEIYFPIPAQERLRWLAKFAQCKVKVVFSGHLHRNLIHRVKRLAISRTAKNMGLLVPEKSEKRASAEGTNAGNSDSEEEEWKEEDVDMELVVSGSSGGAVKGAVEGLRVVQVYRDRFVHEFHALDALPAKIELAQEECN
jgi:3',5'-cyclic AMP phosphodiesterase CpdA